MTNMIRWGILGSANIAVKKVIPSMQKSDLCEISAIASRSLESAEKVANKFNIKKFYSSYDELIKDSEIDAIYNPLPNNLHCIWTIKAAESGKHVLCEKPIGMNAEDVRRLIKVRNQTNVKIQEAFMIRTHPLWITVKDLIDQDRIGNLRSIVGFFSYFNKDETNIRNQLDLGGGALMDIGCYCINISRFIYGVEPVRVTSLIDREKKTGVDRLTSAMLEFQNGHSTFTCSTQLVPYQTMQFVGTRSRITVQIPFNIPFDSPTKIFIDEGLDLFGENIETIEIKPENQYEIQGNLFSRAILENSDQAISLEDSFKNMAVIDAVFRSAKSGNWEIPETL